MNTPSLKEVRLAWKIKDVHHQITNQVRGFPGRYRPAVIVLEAFADVLMPIMGNLDATDIDIIRAATLANAHPFIKRLPRGYDTMLAPDGCNLSQGQRQLLSIARAAISDPIDQRGRYYQLYAGLSELS